MRIFILFTLILQLSYGTTEGERASYQQAVQRILTPANLYRVMGQELHVASSWREDPASRGRSNRRRNAEAEAVRSNIIRELQSIYQDMINHTPSLEILSQQIEWESREVCTSWKRLRQSRIEELREGSRNRQTRLVATTDMSMHVAGLASIAGTGLGLLSIGSGGFLGALGVGLSGLAAGAIGGHFNAGVRYSGSLNESHRNIRNVYVDERLECDEKVDYIRAVYKITPNYEQLAPELIANILFEGQFLAQEQLIHDLRIVSETIHQAGQMDVILANENGSFSTGDIVSVFPMLEEVLGNNQRINYVDLIAIIDGFHERMEDDLLKLKNAFLSYRELYETSFLDLNDPVEEAMQELLGYLNALENGQLRFCFDGSIRTLISSMTTRRFLRGLEYDSSFDLPEIKLTLLRSSDYLINIENYNPGIYYRYEYTFNIFRTDFTRILLERWIRRNQVTLMGTPEDVCHRGDNVARRARGVVDRYNNYEGALILGLTGSRTESYCHGHRIVRLRAQTFQMPSSLFERIGQEK